MTDQQDPIIAPPPELVQRLYGLPQMRAIETAFQAGADQELEACCEWVETDLYSGYGIPHEQLRAARRPKPPSLKKQALEEVSAFEGMGTCNLDIIRRALEALPDD